MYNKKYSYDNSSGSKSGIGTVVRLMFRGWSHVKTKALKPSSSTSRTRSNITERLFRNWIAKNFNPLGTAFTTSLYDLFAHRLNVNATSASRAPTRCND